MALFSMDSKFMKFMDRFSDVFVLNLLWLIFSLPLLTLGASTAAAFAVTMKMVDDEESSVTKEFWKAFRTHWKKATLLWLLQVVALYALYLDFQILTKTDDPPFFLLVISIVSVVFLFCAFLYSYALVARYETSVKNALQNSMKISFQYLGRTALLIGVLTLEGGILLWNQVMLLFGILVGPMILIYTISGVAKRIFQKLDQERTVSP